MAKKEKESAQVLLMQKIKEALPSNISLVDELVDLLKLSSDSVYRRMRGESDFSLEEIASICKHFKFSFDAFINSNDDSLVSFKYNRMDNNPEAFKTYFKSLKKDLDKIITYDEKEVLFAAEDIPVFHHFVFPELAAFKMFYWKKSILDEKDFADKKFDKKLIDSELINIAKDIFECYSEIPSIEVWSDNSANCTIKQIEFYWEAGIFKSKEDALLLCEQVSQMHDRIKRQAALNKKIDAKDKPITGENNYALYHSDVMIGNNCVLVKAAGFKATYLSYHTFNTIVTTNTSFCNETDLWLKNLIRKSNLISGVGEKQRYQYFKTIEDAMQTLKDKIVKG